MDTPDQPFAEGTAEISKKFVSSAAAAEVGSDGVLTFGKRARNA
jgi:hypothetical protein